MTATRPRTIAIGDIHGCSLALAAIVEAIGPTAEDSIVVLGDFIDHGPDSKGVIAQLIELEERCRLVTVMGNHEEMMLAAREQVSGTRYWMKFGGEMTMRSYGMRGSWEIVPRDHLCFIRNCRDYLETDSHIFVHAYYRPDLPLEQQSTTVLRWEFLDAMRAAPHCSNKRAFVGHTCQKSGEILDLGFLVCIDTNCHGGGWLTAVDVDTGEIWQADRDGNPRATMSLRALSHYCK